MSATVAKKAKIRNPLTYMATVTETKLMPEMKTYENLGLKLPGHNVPLE
jgi:hypothetical protein